MSDTVTDWLVRRLSPVKDSNARWKGLATALQTFWEDNFDSLHEDLRDLRSIYTMTKSDLALKMREKGDYFSPDWPTEYDQPLAVAWREGEILRKSTEYILTSTFRRNFRNIEIEWAPLYAPRVGTYGSSFVRSKAAVPLADYWLTSRGKVIVDLLSMYMTGNWSKSTFKPVMERMVKKLKPLHIVYDGAIFGWDLSHDSNIGSSLTSSTSVDILIDAGATKRYDIVRADAATTDTDLNGNAEVTFSTDASININLSDSRVGPLFDDIPLDDIIPIDLN